MKMVERQKKRRNIEHMAIHDVRLLSSDVLGKFSRNLLIEKIMVFCVSFACIFQMFILHRIQKNETTNIFITNYPLVLGFNV
jgi:hypothetical protein